VNKLITILFFILLISCTDYIFDNPLHPQEYIGNWICDSTYVDEVKNNLDKYNFSIMQTGVEIVSSYSGKKIANYNDWNIDNSKDIPTFILFIVVNDNYVSVKTYDVVEIPHFGHMALKLDSVTYYLSN
jgi:hypothetical protein